MAAGAEEPAAMMVDFLVISILSFMSVVRATDRCCSTVPRSHALAATSVTASASAVNVMKVEMQLAGCQAVVASS